MHHVIGCGIVAGYVEWSNIAGSRHSRVHAVRKYSGGS